MQTFDILIVGGGASALALLLQLQQGQAVQQRIAVIAPRASWMTGLAYGQAARDHLLNVPAGNMSLLADQPDQFVDFLRTLPAYAKTPISELRQLFVPRALYGHYLRQQGQAVHAQWIDGRAAALQLNGLVQLADGRTFGAHTIVFATGNARPAARWLGTAEQWLHNDPWQRDLPMPRQPQLPILLLGAGLTMVDTYLSLRARGVDNPVITLSRHGLPPAAGTTYAIVFQRRCRLTLSRHKPSNVCDSNQATCATSRATKMPATSAASIPPRGASNWKSRKSSIVPAPI